MKDDNFLTEIVKLFIFACILFLFFILTTIKCKAQQTVQATASAEIVADWSIISIDSMWNYKVESSNNNIYDIQRTILTTETKEKIIAEENYILIFN